MSKFVQAPGDVLDYAFDWSVYLGTTGDTIQSSTWTADTGITITNPSNTATLAGIRVSGGTLGTQYAIVNRIHMTPSGQIDERTLMISIEGT